MSSTSTKPSTPTKTTSLFDRFWALSWKLKLISLLFVPVVLFYAGTLLLNLFNYSVGERAGVLSKISRKGVACWTTEGELAQPSSRSRAPCVRQRADRQHFLFLRAQTRCPQAAGRPCRREPPCHCNMNRSCSRRPAAPAALPAPDEITGVRLAPAYQPEEFPARPNEPR